LIRRRRRRRRRRRELLTPTLAFRPIECILYRLVDAYPLAEAFSRATLCNFREVARILRDGCRCRSNICVRGMRLNIEFLCFHA